MNNNYIYAEICIEEKDINKDTRIINSFEQYKKEKNGKIMKMIKILKMKKK